MSFESVPSRARLFYHNLLISQTALGKVKRQKSKGKRARGQVAELKDFGYRKVVWYAIHSR